MPKASRIGRPVLLGTVTAFGIWWLGRAYDIDSARLLGLLAASLLFVATLIVLAVGGAVLMRALRRRGRRKSVSSFSKTPPPSAAEVARAANKDQ